MEINKTINHILDFNRINVLDIIEKSKIIEKSYEDGSYIETSYCKEPSLIRSTRLFTFSKNKNIYFKIKASYIKSDGRIDFVSKYANTRQEAYRDILPLVERKNLDFKTIYSIPI